MMFAMAFGVVMLVINLVMTAASVAYSIYSMLNQDTPKTPGMDPEDLQFTTSSEGIILPVIFGEQLVTSNFLSVDKANFRSEAIIERGGGGGKGGGETRSWVSGYNYYLAWEQGLCMGPIDSAGQVYSSPGEIPMRGESSSMRTITFNYTTDQIVLAAHGFVADDPVLFTSSGTLPSPLVADVVYYVSATDWATGAFRVSTAKGGTAIEFADPSTEYKVFDPAHPSGRVCTFNLVTNSVLLTGHGLSYPTQVTFTPSGHLPTPLQALWNYTVYNPLLNPNKFMLINGNIIDLGPPPGAVVVHSVYTPVEYLTAWSDDGSTPTPLHNVLEITLASDTESGTVRLYRGASTQTRTATGDLYASNGMNYRDVCFAVYGIGTSGFLIGHQSMPRTHQWRLRRLPKVTEYDSGAVTASQAGTTAITLSGTLATMLVGRVIRWDTGEEAVIVSGSGTAWVVDRVATITAGLFTLIEFPTRGSGDIDHPCFTEANPAAIVWETLTNAVWGNGWATTRLNVAEFRAAALFFYDNNIGMSLTLSAGTSTNDFLATLAAHVKMIFLWDNGQIKPVVLIDTARVHATIPTFTASMVNNLKFTRPTWQKTFNEIRADFNSIALNYKNDAVAASSLANIQTMGGKVNSKKVNFDYFSDWNVANRQAHRILREIAYPFSQVEFEVSRYGSCLEPGAPFRLVWDEIDTGTVTGYFVVTKISAQGEALKIQAAEDPDIPPVDGEELTITSPTAQPWQGIADMDAAAIQNTTATLTDKPPIYPIKAFEFPPVKTGGAADSLLVLGERASGVTSLEVYGAPASPSTDFQDIGQIAGLAIAGQLTTPLAAGGYEDRQQTDSGAVTATQAGTAITLSGSLTEMAAGCVIEWDTGEKAEIVSGSGTAWVAAVGATVAAGLFTVCAPSFRFMLWNTAYEANILAANMVKDLADTFTPLVAAALDYLIIDSEIILLGVAEKLGTNDYRARNLFRGRFGTTIGAYPAGTTFFYLRTMLTGLPKAGTFLTTQQDLTIQLIGYPVGTGGMTQVGTAFDWPFTSRGSRPIAPVILDAPDNAGQIQAVLRPRFAAKGIEADPLYGLVASFTQSVPFVESLDGMTFMYQLMDGATPLNAIPLSVGVASFVPEEGVVGSGRGIVNLADIAVSTADSIRVWAVLSGQTSPDYGTLAIS